MAVSIKDYEFRGRTFDEWKINEEIITGARTVTETDIVNFAGLTSDWSATHTNDVYGKSTIYGSRIAYGNVTLIISLGLIQQTLMLEGTMIALKGFRVSYQEPVRFQDTLWVKFWVEDKSLDESGNQGIIKIHALTNNQNDEQVAEEEFVFSVLTEKPRLK